MAERYSVQPYRWLGPSGVMIDGFRVVDNHTGLTAKGTRGAGGRPGGYDHRRTATAAARDLNREEERRRKDK